MPDKLTPTAAAEQWLAARAAIKVHKPKLESAERVLKAHFRAKGTAAFKGVGYALSTYLRLDTTLARAALGPKKVAECEITAERETLSALS